ncbi:MAG TPA: polysaccharide deacetylase family protein [Kofleriaceae bacterium]|nr:polysaccharide deacetylase family protein [Kofleriaceae bacterium]
MSCRRAIALIAMLGFVPVASAKNWPLPAAGPSVSGDPELILTFDDGPSPTNTPKVLDILAKHHLKVIFFMVGEMAGSANRKVPAIIERIRREGHIIGTHTMTHQNLCKVNADRAAKEIDDGKATVERAAGIKTTWFRAPYGVRCTRLETMLAERHLQHFHWDLDPQEWKHHNAERAVKYVTAEVGRMTGRNVLLMHDIHEATVNALPEILDWIDAENARRAAAHKRQIRIISGPELAAERIQPGLVAFLADTVASTRVLRTAVADLIP